MGFFSLRGRPLIVCCWLSVLAVVSTAEESTTMAYPVTSDVTSKDGLVDAVNVDCHQQEMLVTLSTLVPFHGMVYPRGLTKKSPCMAEFDVQLGDQFTYRVPLRSCNTMFIDTEDGFIEYFNTIVVQPHKKLVTNQGRGYHVRCRYQTKDTAIISGFNVSFTGSTKLDTTSPLPGTMMHIYAGDAVNHVPAENVKIGDPLTLKVALDQQEVYGMTVADCTVRDGLGWSEQLLYNDQGCPVDYEIMPPFEYDVNKTSATVKFQAHKFPYTSSVYYQCNVRLCLRDGGCEEPPLCDNQGNNLRRKRRQVEEEDGPKADYRIDHPSFARNATTVEVFGGFYVTDATDGGETRLFDGEPIEENKDDQLCISPRDFAIGIAVAGLILMIAVVAAILFLCARRRHKRVSSTTGSSVYSGPYTNTAYSHSS
ncbi:hypothetical protein GHT06_019267 [Daphnia sinensis]|uniref:ZP domain-containing protein n=1 Tax=Daphnia sinensis TaxID=1820382 RepID=A0AAD5PND2_9CRUS|nr:hypothetical protein GHT06_019267 [Daphnia sinensis]